MSIEGMTLRDWFAGQALAPIVDHWNLGVSTEERERIAAEAYRYADAMMKAREAGNDSE